MTKNGGCPYFLPTDVPVRYSSWINTTEEKKVVESIRRSVVKGTPYGGEVWIEKMVINHKLQSSLRSPGRPKKV
jgi:hypothetical protein